MPDWAQETRQKWVEMEQRWKHEREVAREHAPKMSPGQMVAKSQALASLSQVDYDGSRLCGVNKEHEVFCSNDEKSWTSFGKGLPGKEFTQVTVGDDALYAIDEKHQVHKRSMKKDSKWANLGGGGEGESMLHIDADGPRLCGVTVDNKIKCWERERVGPKEWKEGWVEKQGIPQVEKNGHPIIQKPSSVSITSDDMYITTTDDYIFKRVGGIAPPEATWMQIPGKLHSISAYSDRLCGANTKGAVYCTYNDGKKWQPTDGELHHREHRAMTQVTTYGDKLYGVDQWDYVIKQDL